MLTKYFLDATQDKENHFYLSSSNLLKYDPCLAATLNGHSRQITPSMQPHEERMIYQNYQYGHVEVES